MFDIIPSGHSNRLRNDGAILGILHGLLLVFRCFKFICWLDLLRNQGHILLLLLLLHIKNLVMSR